MPKISAKRILAATLLVVLLALGAGGVFLLPKLLHLDNYKEQFLAQVQDALGRRVLYETGAFSFRFGPSFTFTKVAVKEKDASTDFITADRLTLTIAIFPLIEKRLVIRDLVLEKPAITVNRDRDGIFNIDDLLKRQKEPSVALRLNAIRLKEATIRYSDLAVSEEGFRTVLEDTDFTITHMERGKKSDIKLSTTLAGRGSPGAVALSGTVKTSPEGQPLTESLLHLKLLAKNVDTAPFWPYYSNYVPFRQIVGRLDYDGTLKGKLAAFTSSGTVRMRGLRFDYPQVFHAILTPRDLHFKYDMELTPQDVLVKSLDLSVDDLDVKGSCFIRNIHSGDPRITAKAVTSRFRLEDFGAYVPYGIIVKDTADFIEAHIKGGTYKLDDGRLDGLVSQIVHMERGTNYNVLSINGHVEKGVVSYGPSVPTFNNIKGELELKGKDFSLRKMSGNFGSSPLTLDGKITDYPLDTPSGYPFAMNMVPHRDEVAWLCGWLKGNKPVLNGESRLRLHGEGHTDNYQLKGEWDLTTSAYSIPDIITKPTGRANTISFSSSLTKQEARFTGVQYDLAPLSMKLAGTYRFSSPSALSLDIRANQFQLNDIAPLVPLAVKYKTGGKIQGAVHGEASGSDLSQMKWNGSVSFAGFSFKPTERVKTVSDMNGTITFKGTTLETSRLSARVGNSVIFGKGSVAGFKSPTLNLAFSSPAIDPADFGFRSPQQPLRISRVKGDISYNDKTLLINSLSAQINRSQVSVKGSARQLGNLQAELAVVSPHLEIEDMVLLTGLEPDSPRTRNEPPPSLTASVTAETGKMWGVDFSKLASSIIYEGNILYLQPTQCSLLDGHLSARGRADFSNDAPRLQASIDLSRIDADRFLKACGIKKQELTGTLSLKADLTAKGNDEPEIRKTMLGSIKLECEEGSLRRFSVLSKIFSILNLSQLLKFQLPDMVSGGMPYNDIKGSFAVRDGVVTTSDLYVSSDAINISTVGKLDLTTNDIEATVGVQPLQTIDKVVSKIPVVGWLLTGKDKSLITAYFEVKGKVGDPTVNAIPVKSMAKGVFNVFKRIFQLPAKVFTDTGEVFIGK